MTRIIPVFVNARKVEVSDDASALDAVRAWSIDAAAQVAAGERVVLDDRGLPIEPERRVHGGAIYRLVPARDRAASDDADLPG
jgi:hypothetical protein